MFSLRRPTDAHVQRLLDRQRSAELTYEPVGAVLTGACFNLPTRRVCRSLGAATHFEVARDALRRWEQYDLGWTYVANPKPPIVAGEVFATVARTGGLWSVNCCRIVNVVDEPDRFGYSIGTLPHHVETGEELFLLTRMDKQCNFEIHSASGPNHPVIRLAWGYAERQIHRFIRDAGKRLEEKTAV